MQQGYGSSAVSKGYIAIHTNDYLVTSMEPAPLLKKSVWFSMVLMLRMEAQIPRMISCVSSSSGESSSFSTFSSHPHCDAAIMCPSENCSCDTSTWLFVFVFVFVCLLRVVRGCEEGYWHPILDYSRTKGMSMRLHHTR